MANRRAGNRTHRYTNYAVCRWSAASQRERLHPRLFQIVGHDAGIMRERDLGLLDLRVPLLFPFKAVVPLVAGTREDLDLCLDGYLAGADQNISTVCARGLRVFEVRVADPSPERPPCVCRLLLSRDERVVRVPQQRECVRADMGADPLDIVRV